MEGIWDLVVVGIFEGSSGVSMLCVRMYGSETQDHIEYGDNALRRESQLIAGSTRLTRSYWRLPIQ